METETSLMRTLPLVTGLTRMSRDASGQSTNFSRNGTVSMLWLTLPNTVHVGLLESCLASPPASSATHKGIYSTGECKLCRVKQDQILWEDTPWLSTNAFLYRQKNYAWLFPIIFAGVRWKKSEESRLKWMNEWMNEWMDQSINLYNDKIYIAPCVSSESEAQDGRD